jgi:hypothetical protein
VGQQAISLSMPAKRMRSLNPFKLTSIIEPNVYISPIEFTGVFRSDPGQDSCKRHYNVTSHEIRAQYSAYALWPRPGSERAGSLTNITTDQLRNIEVCIAFPIENFNRRSVPDALRESDIVFCL